MIANSLGGKKLIATDNIEEWLCIKTFVMTLAVSGGLAVGATLARRAGSHNKAVLQFGGFLVTMAILALFAAITSLRDDTDASQKSNVPWYARRHVPGQVWVSMTPALFIINILFYLLSKI